MADKSGKTCLALFRYQILPISRERQLSLFDEKCSLEEVIRNKNNFFYKSVNELKSFVWRKRQGFFNILGEESNVILARMSIEKDLKRYTKNYEKEEIDSWPFINLLIDNNPDSQILAIEFNRDAFSDVEVASYVFMMKLNRILKDYWLSCYVKPIVVRDDFWGIVEEYRGDIQRIKFNLITPNMSNISESLSADLEDIAVSTNANETSLSLHNPVGGSLTPDRENSKFAGLVNYAAAGGGDAEFKIRGLRITKKTKDSVMSVEIDELIFSEDNLESVMSSVKRAVDD